MGLSRRLPDPTDTTAPLLAPIPQHSDSLEPRLIDPDRHPLPDGNAP